MALHITGTIEITNTETGETVSDFMIDISDATDDEVQRLFDSVRVKTVEFGDIDMVATHPGAPKFSDLDFAMTEPHAERPREEAVRSRIVGAELEGDFDKANELDAEFEEMKDALDAVSVDMGAAGRYVTVPGKPAMSPEELATRAYLAAMVAAGWELVLGSHVTLDDGTKTMKFSGVSIAELVARLMTPHSTTSYRLERADGKTQHFCGGF
jgi:hypothetical protein